MGTRSQGTFVLSWAQTETDGLPAAPPYTLSVGSLWRWSGDAVCVDGATGLLVLQDPGQVAADRKRAARAVRRLVGVAKAAPPVVSDMDESAAEEGFVLTDGHRTYEAALIAARDMSTPLVMFSGDPPPSEKDLWVVKVTLGCHRRPQTTNVAGGLICFTPGTRIRTPDGSAAIEDLAPGDLVQTRDDGAQPVLWSGRRRLTGARLHALPALRPIRFRMGALGQGRPEDDLLVSPHHRMLVSGAVAQSLFNSDEVLVRAADLVNDHSIAVDHALREVTYVHLLLERHQILWANGLPSESFHPANADAQAMDAGDRASLLSVMPGLATAPESYGSHARRNLSAGDAAILRYASA